MKTRMRIIMSCIVAICMACCLTACNPKEKIDEFLTPTSVEEAMAAVGEVTGRTVREDVVEAVFSRFCVGK